MIKYKTLFLANNAEIAQSILTAMSPAAQQAEIFEDHAYCDRFVCSDQDLRILVTPLPLDPDFFQNTNRLLKFKQVINLFPQQVDVSLCLAILQDKALRLKLIKLIRANPGIKIISYAATDQFFKLINFFKKQNLNFQTPEAPSFAKRWLAGFVDSKAGFRQTWGQLNQKLPQLPQGAICYCMDELIGWALELYHQHQGIVLKINRGLAGEGIEIINQSGLNDRSLTQLIRQRTTQAYWQNDIAVIEKYIKPNLQLAGGSPSVEFQIFNGQTRYLYSCGMRINSQGVFMGMEIGKNAVPRFMARTLEKAGRRFVKHLASLGYQGFFDIDWVYGLDKKLYPIEANLRRTGGTHTFELAKRLLGDNFEKNYYLISQNKLHAPALKSQTYAQVKAKLQPILYPLNQKKEGLIITMVNYLVKGWLGYIIIAADKSRANQLEQRLLNLVIN